jgi:hypothetical protein
MPAYFSPNGLTDGWHLCRDALKDTRALCKDDLKEDERKDIHHAIVILDKMLG